MTDQHPIKPSLILIDLWWEEAQQNAKYDEPIGPIVATKAAQWGADQELAACVNYIDNNMSGNKARELRAIRRPKPPSLKEQALSELNLTADPDGAELSQTQVELIRRALEALPND